PGQLARARQLAGSEIKGALVNPYHATCDGRGAGTAYFDAHVVRTLPETLMVVVDPQDKVSRVEVLSFAEPEDYLPPGRWYGQFPGKALNDELALGHSVRGVTGASLTARATTEAVRRVLAIHQALHGTPEKTKP
ncbi:MAG TPA: FMN-binding protein, partial [Thermoanaerobaculia bacterium]|nr:FMN-binding protein [Thermoanaerobaculia bacterium]